MKSSSEIRYEVPPSPNPSPDKAVSRLKDTIEDWVHTNSMILLIMLGIIAWKSFVQPFVQSLMFRISYSRSQENSIREALARIQAYTNADRVLLCQFISRTTTNAGQPVYEMIVSHEVTKLHNNKAMPYGNYSSFGCVNHIIKSLNEQSFHKKEISKITDDDYRSYLANLNVSFVVYRYIVSSDKPIGFIALHYCDSVDRMDWEAVTDSDIAYDSDRILFVLKQNNSFVNFALSCLGFR